MTDLTILVPSRGRPHTVREMAEAFVKTCTADTTLAFVVDFDDPRLGDYIAEAHNVWDSEDSALAAVGLEFFYHYPDRDGRGMVAALNTAARNLCINWVGTGECTDPECPEPPHEAPFAIGFMGDDHRPRTLAWDEQYINTLACTGALFVYGDDLLQGANFPTQVAMRSDVVKTLGYMAPPEFEHLCIDLVWRDWGERIGRLKYLDDVVVEHMHPAAGKAELDAGYERVNSVEVTTKDAERYYVWFQAELPGELEKLDKIP